MISAMIYGALTVIIGFVSPPMARRIARMWCLNLLIFTRVRLNVIGAANIDIKRNYVFIANHQGYFDIPVLYVGLGSAISFVAKKELFSIPFFGWGMTFIGCIPMDRKNPRKARESITKAVSMIRKNNMSLALFPEGTRSISGEVGEFKRGSFTLALEAGVPVVPVVIRGTNAIHRKGSLTIQPAAVTISIGEPIATDDIEKMDKEQLSDMTRKIIVEAMGKINSKSK
jgi:1-acyl-sn-glycerol-3-phosphate acyltransferase